MTDDADRIRDIVIVGGGTAGWMTAAALARQLGGTELSITLVESAAIGTVGVGEATLPQIRDFNRLIGIDEATMMAATGATIKLGIEFRDWGRTGDRYVHPFGAYGEPIGPAHFHHYWVKARHAGKADAFSRYCFPIVAAWESRFRPPRRADSALFAFNYAFQFDASLYGTFLAEFARRKGVVRREGRILEVEGDGETGFITGVRLESGEAIAGDLFVDCSGFRGLLIEQYLETGFEDWSRWLPCNRAWAVPCAIDGPVGPYTRATARDAGWQWRIPLQHRIGNGHVYCDAYLGDQEAVDQLMANLEAEAIDDPRQLFFITGKRKRLWNKNCIAIGLSGGFLEPLESTSIDLIQSGILNLIALFPERECTAADRDEYNRLMDLEFERVRDFLMLHYVATERDEPFWHDRRETELPDSLTQKIEAFRRRGIVPEYEHGLFLPPSWLSVFIGQNVIPENWDPRVDRMPEANMTNELARIRAAIDAEVARTGDHCGFIERYGASFDGARAGRR